MFKKIAISIMCLMVTFVPANSTYSMFDPGSEFKLNVIIVAVKAEFQEEFNSQQFTVEDFNLPNIDDITYYPFGNLNPEKTNGYIKVYLKEQGEDKVLEAIEHCEQLNFVYSASKDSRYPVDRFFIYIEEDFHQKFIEQQFIIEDFKWDNLESITYDVWYNTSNKGQITVYLKEHGKQQLLDAIEHFKKLNFVKDAEIANYQYID